MKAYKLPPNPDFEPSEPYMHSSKDPPVACYHYQLLYRHSGRHCPAVSRVFDLRCGLDLHSGLDLRWGLDHGFRAGLVSMSAAFKRTKGLVPSQNNLLR